MKLSASIKIFTDFPELDIYFPIFVNFSVSLNENFLEIFFFLIICPVFDFCRMNKVKNLIFCPIDEICFIQLLESDDVNVNKLRKM